VWGVGSTCDELKSPPPVEFVEHHSTRGGGILTLFPGPSRGKFVVFSETCILASEEVGLISGSPFRRAYPILIVERLVSVESQGRAAPSSREARVNRIALFS
jgi:hypothetical protein